MEWQPIETAPINGEIILVIDEWGECACCYYDQRDECWMINMYSAFNEPTHWMPLPKPPVK